MQVCPGCGESSPDRFSECAFCGAPLGERRAIQEERKVLTVVFCDLKDSTALGESLDPEALGEVLDLYFTTTTRVLQRHGGAIQKFIGDAVVAAFGLPIVHEDDALRAVRAAVEMREALGKLNRQLEAGYGVGLEVRMGVYTGEVVVRTAVNDQQVLTGDTLNTAARLEQAAGTNEILIGEPTYRLIRDAIVAEQLPPLELKGKSQPVGAHRLLRVFGDEQSSRHHDAPMVGREEEQRTLLRIYGDAVSERRCHLTTVVGEAGVGKSRLVRALIEATTEEALVLRGRCLPYGEGITFWPIRSIVGEACDIGPDDPAEIARAKLNDVSGDAEVTRRVASALGWSSEQLPVAELFWATRELLERLARERQLVLVIDDVHWAAPTLLGLIDHLVESVDDGPMLLLATARPDMLEARPDWSDGPRRTRLTLDRLPDGAAAQVIDNLMSGSHLADEARSVIIQAAEGNPLFVEQLVSMLIDSGVLAETEQGWQVSRSLDRLEIPPSINALLAARLDMLTSEERSIIEPASVIGLEFPSLAVQELSTLEPPDHVPMHLADIIRKQLVRPAVPGSGELADHRFHHILIRDAAYRRTLKRARAALHEQFADWLVHFVEERARQDEQDQIIGYHFEQAYRYRGELGPADAHTRALGARAAENLSSAGKRAFARGDLPAAVSLVGRAVHALPPLDPFRLALLPDLAEALMETGDFDRALAVLSESEEPGASAANGAEVARCRLVRLHIELSAGTEDQWAARVRREVEASLALFEGTDHHAGMATAWRLAYGIDAAEGQYDAAAAAAEQVITHARAAGDVRQERRASVAYAQSALYGSTPVDEAAGRCEELIAAVEGDRRTESLVQLSLSHLLAMRGDFDSARSLYRSAQQMLNELGRSVLSLSTSLDSAAVELLARDFESAERELRRDLADLESIGETYLRSTVAGLLARVLVLTGDVEESERIALGVKALAAPDDADAQVLWRSALALRRSGQDRVDEALLLADEAVSLGRAGTDPHRAAQSLTDRATVRLDAHRPEDAAMDLADALAIHKAKGNLVEAAAVERLVSQSLRERRDR